MPSATTRDPETTPVVVACCRTAIGRSHPERGIFRHVRGDELAAAVIAAVVERSGVEPATIEDVVLGATQQRGELGGNAGRCAGLMAGLPLAAAGTTVNRLCGSSLQALAQACHAIAAGAENVQVVAGVEHMHHLPMRRQGEYALESHARAVRAGDAGLFDDEIVTVFGHDESGAAAEMLLDQSIRRDTSLEAMATLEPAFLPQLGTITAATSAPVSDGAAALLVMSEAEAARQRLEPWARVLATAVVGVPPAAMGTGPIAATRKLLARVAGRGIGVADLGIVELNEAFAAQAIHCIDELGLDPARVNVRGGALAIGHPLGASGARIATTLLHAMRDETVPLGLATMCIGLGQGIAVLFERCE